MTAKQTTIAVPGDEPHPSCEWEIVYSDTFDRETPSKAEVAGKGLIPSLVELWARFLFETVHDGNKGFSSFTLWIKLLMVHIDGDMSVAQRIKEWVFGGVTQPMRSVLDEANLDVLYAISRAHARSVEPKFAEAAAQNAWIPTNESAAIFDAAARASSVEEFVSLLSA